MEAVAACPKIFMWLACFFLVFFACMYLAGSVKGKIWCCVSNFKKYIYRTPDSLKENIFGFENQETEAWIHITRQKTFSFFRHTNISWLRFIISLSPTLIPSYPGWLFLSHIFSYHHIMVDYITLTYSHYFKHILSYTHSVL